MDLAEAAVKDESAARNRVIKGQRLFPGLLRRPPMGGAITGQGGTLSSPCWGSNVASPPARDTRSVPPRGGQ